MEEIQFPGMEVIQFPQDGGDSVPRDGEDSVPRDGEDSVPRDGGDSVPRDGGDSVPRDGEDSVPRDGGDSVPRVWYTREVATMDKDQLGTNTHNVSIHNNVISRAHLIIQYVTSPLSQRRSMRRSGGRITAPVFDLVMIGLRAVSTCLSASVDS